ncbi:MAG: peptidoglycan-binding domain-containing protein [Acidimicrobiales bacterium]
MSDQGWQRGEVPDPAADRDPDGPTIGTHREEPAAPAAPAAPAQQSGGGGGFFDSFVADFAEQMGVEWSELQLTDGPWLEVDKIGWRVHNSGNTDVPSHNVFIRIADSSGTLLEKEESRSEPVGADQYKDFEFSLTDFNTKLEAEHQMQGGGGAMPSEWEVYRFDLFVDTSSGYDKGGSIEFGVELEEAKATAGQHEKRGRVERKERKDYDADEDFADEESPDVRHLQERLHELGYYQGQVDGRFGDATEEALAWFKADNSLSANGKVVGERTWEVLNLRWDEKNDEAAGGNFRKVKGFRYA